MDGHLGPATLPAVLHGDDVVRLCRQGGAFITEGVLQKKGVAPLTPVGVIASGEGGTPFLFAFPRTRGTTATILGSLRTPRFRARGAGLHGHTPCLGCGVLGVPSMGC